MKITASKKKFLQISPTDQNLHFQNFETEIYHEISHELDETTILIWDKNKQKIFVIGKHLMESQSSFHRYLQWNQMMVYIQAEYHYHD